MNWLRSTDFSVVIVIWLILNYGQVMIDQLSLSVNRVLVDFIVSVVKSRIWKRWQSEHIFDFVK